MGVPKRKVSKARKNKRRSIWRQTAGPSVVECPHCRKLMQAHHICPHCGYYRGQRVVVAD